MSLPDDREKSLEKAGAVARSERRAEPRIDADQPATLRLLNPLQASVRIFAHVIESSRGGLKLRLDRPLMPGTLIQVRTGGRLLLGEVRFCNSVGSVFHAGVRLQDVFETKG